jgi:hypothetical protein
MRHFLYPTFFLIPLLAAGFVLSQEAPADKVTVTFTDPSRPGTLKASLLEGSINIKGYQGKEVIIEANARERGSHRGGERADGMKRLQSPGAGLTVEEENNVMNISVGAMGRGVNLSIQVPTRTSLKLSTVNDGDITVERVQGEIEVNNVNGKVTLTNISGSVIAHALNENVVAVFDAVTPGKTMSFSSLNGNIDVTFPQDVKANVVMKSDQGEIYSDFDIRMDPSGRPPVVKDSRKEGGKYRIRLEKALYGTINGGGPEMQFKNFNGDIYIRKKK